MPSPIRKTGTGAVLVIVALWMFVLLAFAGLAISVGQLCAAKQHAQDAADAAVMAGASAWRPYMYKPDPEHPGKGTWPGRDGEPASPADVLEMSDTVTANDYNTALDLGDLDMQGTPTRLLNNDTFTLTVTISPLVKCTTGVLFHAFVGSSGEVAVPASVSAVITAQWFSWAVGEVHLTPLESSADATPLPINPEEPAYDNELFSVGLPDGVGDPEEFPPAQWVGREQKLCSWSDSHTALIEWVMEDDVFPDNKTAWGEWLKLTPEERVRSKTRRLITVPMFTPDSLDVVSKIATLFVNKVEWGMDKSVPPKLVPVLVWAYCVADSEVGAAPYLDRHWHWSYRLLP